MSPINVENLKNRSAITFLQDYSGINPYIKQLKINFFDKKIKLTENQLRYIIDNHDKEPIKLNKIIQITPFLGEELQKQDEVKFIPTKIMVEYLLADTEKAFHVYGKLKQNQEKSRMYWLAKTQVITDIYFDDVTVDVDFEKYEQMDSLKRKLYDHQKSGVKFLLSRNGCILGDDMGVGKSKTAIVAALESGANHILVVCPASVKINWRREIECYTDDVVIVSGNKWKQSKFTIINYDILKNFHTVKERGKKQEDIVLKRELIDAKFDIVIIDEAHKLKNPKSIRGKIMAELSIKFNIPRVWLLTGTPITNRPMDYFNLLRIIKNNLSDNWVFYTKRYCAGRRFFKKLKTGVKKEIWLTDGASNLEELANKTKNIILRRKKEDVLDMPDKTIVPLFHELEESERSEYDTLWDEYVELRQAEGKPINLQRDLTESMLLRKFIAMKSIPRTIDIAENAIEQGHKVIIFTTFTDELLTLANYFGSSAVTHYGKMTDKQKQRSIDEFMNNSKITVFIGNVISAGVGINLTAADIIVFNSFDWTPGNNIQAEDRAFRIGQKNNVTIYYHLFMRTVSTYMWKVLDSKKNIIAIVMRDKSCTEDEAIKIILEDELKYDANKIV